MKKRKLLALILAMVMMISSVSVVQAAEIGDSEIAPASTFVPAQTTLTIGRANYTLYAYTMSLGYVGEAYIEYTISSYTSGTTTDEKTVEQNRTKTLSIVSGQVTRITLATDAINTGSKTSKGTTAKFSTQSADGLYVIYALSNARFSCNNTTWNAYSYHENNLISLGNEPDYETE